VLPETQSHTASLGHCEELPVPLVRRHAHRNDHHYSARDDEPFRVPVIERQNSAPSRLIPKLSGPACREKATTDQKALQRAGAAAAPG